MKIVLEKLKELPDAEYPNNIEVGRQVVGLMVNKPVVGQCFWVGHTYRTSLVQEIIDENTFRTLDSIYRYSMSSI